MASCATLLCVVTANIAQHTFDRDVDSDRDDEDAGRHQSRTGHGAERRDDAKAVSQHMASSIAHDAAGESTKLLNSSRRGIALLDGDLSLFRFLFRAVGDYDIHRIEIILCFKVLNDSCKFF